MKDKKSLISTILLCGGLLLAVCGIFCFFGPALKTSGPTPAGQITITLGSVFVFMFGGEVVMKANPDPGMEIPGLTTEMTVMLTVVFVLTVIAIILAIVAGVGLFTKKLDSKKVMILVCAISVLMLVGAIMALASKNAILKAAGMTPIPEASVGLGSGLIAYAVLSFVGVVANVAGIVLKKKTAAN